MFAEEDENPFANAVSPFGTSSVFQPTSLAIPNEIATTSSATAILSSVNYGPPLDTPILSPTEERVNPYVQAIQYAKEDDALGNTSVPSMNDPPSGRAVEDPMDGTHGTVFGDASGSGGGFQVAPPSESFKFLDLNLKMEGSAQETILPTQDERYQHTPSSQPPTFSVDPYDNSQDPYSLFGSSSSPYTSTSAVSSEFAIAPPLSSLPASPLAPKHMRKDSFDPLAAILGESEEVKMKSAFKRSSNTTSSPSRSTSLKKKETLIVKKEVEDEDDPFASLIKNKKRNSKPSGSKPNSAPSNTVSSAAPLPRPVPNKAPKISSLIPADDDTSPKPSSSSIQTHSTEALSGKEDSGLTPKATTTELPISSSSINLSEVSTLTKEDSLLAVIPAEIVLPESRASTPPPHEPIIAPSPPIASQFNHEPAMASPLQPAYPSTFQLVHSSNSSASSSSSHSTYTPTPPHIERSLSSITLPPPGMTDPNPDRGWSKDEDSTSDAWGDGTVNQVNNGPESYEENRKVRREASNVALRGTGDNGSFFSGMERDDEEETETNQSGEDVTFTSTLLTDDTQDTASATSFRESAAKAVKIMDIKVGDPTKKGIGAAGHIVYTVTTRHLIRGGETSVLRRFSDFLWLFGALQNNNPGVVVPPVPDKHPFGRFAEEFVETRRNALEKCIQKMANHPVLQLDADFRTFLESDSLTHHVKSKKAEQVTEQKGYLATLTSGLAGPKFHERDEWFDDKKSVLETLESQLKALVKSIELVSKQRLDMATAVSEFADTVSGLAVCDLSQQLSHALERFADIGRRVRDLQEENAKGDVVTFMTTSDEYIRLIASVRLAFASRIKLYFHHQNLESELRRLRSAFEKARRAGKAYERGPEAQGLAEAERRAKEAEAEFNSVSRLVKVEYGRFENERIEDFKKALEGLVEGMISRQKLLIAAWEDFHRSLLRLVQQNIPSTPSHPRSDSQVFIETHPSSTSTNISSDDAPPESSMTAVSSLVLSEEEAPVFKPDNLGPVTLPTEPENAWA
uniref:Membrane coat complex retromer subunit VPS5/SNX1 n=1 Tax=Phaffia rhodozyma TaxID=264483 RepID=A0A1C9U6C5_PHARH|nr:membrane coat complex retromer subunit VPS5/SNX1 [Phaffia rhodozyma]